MNHNKQENSAKGFGTFRGVFIPSILTIFGVIMYLRSGWVVGNVGLLKTIIIVTVSSAITFITALSISSIATNMKVKVGGAYYMISRSFGVEAGAAVGISLFFAQAVGISFYVIGFAESLQGLVPWIPVRIIAVISLIAMTIIAYISANLALKTQVVIFAIIVASIASLLLGTTPADGFSVPDVMLQPENSFWVVFAVFFPAVTGILTGVSMSGDLKEPEKSIPVGTLAAVCIGYIAYLAIPIFLYFVVPKEMLISNSMVMRDVALIGGIIFLGIWGATLSSALGSLLGAPRTLQALAKDKIVPSFLAKGYGELNEPRVATFISFVIAFIAILLGDLNAIAPILSMFFLTTYGTLNLIAGIEDFISAPSWRPTFKTHWGISVSGAVLCLIAMLMINAGATIIAVVIIVALYYITRKRSLKPHWTDIKRSILMSLARFSVNKLADTKDNARVWKPNILVLSGLPTKRLYLIELADAITHGKGFLTVASIVKEEDMTEDKKESLEKTIKNYLKDRDIPALVEVKNATNFLEGAEDLIKNYGIGTITPNIILLGETEKYENFTAFSELIKLVHKAERNMLIVREADIKKTVEQKTKEIYLWWRGKQNNAGLMLTLAHMLQTGPEWEDAKIILKTIVENKEDQKATFIHLKEFIEKSRLEVLTDVIIADRTKDYIPSIIRKESQGADLVFLGMKPPKPDEKAEEYASYYEHLIHDTEGFPAVAIVLAGEDIKFSEIFD